MKKSTPLRRAATVTALIVVVAVAGLAAGACGGSGDGGVPGSGSADTIVGAGASFPFPLYSKWGQEYNGVSGMRLNYQSIGSGGGISAIKAGTVDFGASDAPLESAELEESGLVQFPLIVGGVVPVVNIEGVGDGELRLTPDALAGIYMGTITEWDDREIAELNPDLDLPSSKISVVNRSDGSGTTWIFTHYLTAAAGNVWTAGADKEIAWPVGVGGKGNEGVSTSVQQLKGSIGYVEYAYAKETGLATTQLQNKDGEWVAPTLETFGSAAEQADWASAPDLYMVLVDQPGADTWPITGASFIMVRQDQADAGRAESMLQFFDWCFRNGASSAEALNYVPIPTNVYELIQGDYWSRITAAESPVWQP
jgi:phosphate transport system substrate-binding protein